MEQITLQQLNNIAGAANFVVPKLVTPARVGRNSVAYSAAWWLNIRRNTLKLLRLTSCNFGAVTC
jgi:hypothetical protein